MYASISVKICLKNPPFSLDMTQELKVDFISIGIVVLSVESCDDPSSVGVVWELDGGDE